jgi:N12 class adenine-specific DNA methylase
MADEQFEANAEALTLVQPPDLSASEIDARLGSMWIPPDDISQFVKGLLGEEGISVSHAPQLGLWVVRGGYSVRYSVANSTEWGTDRCSALELLEDALNLRTPTV